MPLWIWFWWGDEPFTDKLEMKAYPVNMFLDTNGIVTQIEIGCHK